MSLTSTSASGKDARIISLTSAGSLTASAYVLLLFGNFLRQAAAYLGEKLVLMLDLGLPFGPVHAQKIRDHLFRQPQTRHIDRLGGRHETNRRLDRFAFAFGAVQDPQKHP